MLYKKGTPCRIARGALKKKMIKIWKISDMHCTACAMNIDFELEDALGVKSAKTNYAKALTEVEYDPEILDEKKIEKIIKKIGYSATLNF